MDATRPAGAEAVLRRVTDALRVDAVDTTVEPYPKGGHVARFGVTHGAGPWAERVVAVIALGERLGSGWRLSGSVWEDPSGWLARGDGRIRVPGVAAAEWTLLREGDR